MEWIKTRLLVIMFAMAAVLGGYHAGVVYAADTSVEDVSAGEDHLDEPTISVAMKSSGIKVKWSKVDGAEGYYIYRKTADARWKKIASVSSDQTVYMDKKAVVGTLYYYSVRAYAADWVTGYAKEEKAARLTVPELTKAVSTSKGCKIKWKAVSGAEQYVLYRRKAGTSAWEKIKTVTGTYCTDTTAKKSVSYEYSVRAKTGKCMTAEGKNDIYCVFTDKEVVAQALKVVNSCIKASQTQEQKLRACYNWMYCYTYSYSYHTVFDSADIPKYALQAFKTHVADCYRFAASLGYMAKVLGYDDVWLCKGYLNRGCKHGFNEIKIDGKIYLFDSELDIHHHQRSGCNHPLFKVTYATYHPDGYTIHRTGRYKIKF